MATTQEKWQEIANRGLQDRFDPQTRAKFDEAVKRGLITITQQAPQQPPVNANVVQQPISAPVPGEDVSAIPGEVSVAGQQPERTIGETLEGLGEAALTLGTGATTGALGFLGGTVEGIGRTLAGDTTPQEAMKIAQQRASSLTNLPESEAGQEFVKNIGEALGVLPPVGLTGGITPKIAIPKFQKSKGAQARDVIAAEIKEGNINAGNIAKTLDAKGKLITNKNTKRAIELLGKGDEAYSTAINFEKMNPATKSQVNKMLDIIEANKKSGDPSQTMTNRPVDAIGQSLAKRVDKLNEIKKTASKQIGDLINGDLGGKPVNISNARDDFISALNDADIGVGMADNKLIADTSRTLTNIDEVVKLDKLNNILSRLQRGNIPAKEAHRLKRNLREMVSFDATAPGATKVSAEIENAFKKLSSDLGGSISQVDKRYRAANQKMADSLGALMEVDRQLGKQIMIGDELATSKLGALSKRIGSNLASREQVISMVDGIDSALNKRGIRPKDDIKRQVAALADLEKIFKVEGEQSPFGFQARVTRGVADVATGGQVGATRELLDAAVNRFRTMGQLEFNDKIKALRALSKVGK